MQGHIQAIAIASLSQQRGGSGRIARRRLGVIEEILREGGTDRANLCRRAEAQLHALPDGAPVSRQLKCLPHANIVSRRTVGADARHVMRVRWQIDRVEAEIPAEI